MVMVQISQRGTSPHLEHCTTQLLPEPAVPFKGEHRFKYGLSTTTERTNMYSKGLFPLLPPLFFFHHLFELEFELSLGQSISSFLINYSKRQ